MMMVPQFLSIEEDSGMVAENAGPAQFMLIARGLTATETIMIKATPAEDGHDFLTDLIAGTEDPKDVVFTDPDGDNIYTGLFPVTLDDDEDGEATGTIKLTLSANTGVYILTSDIEGVITVLDDDAPELKIKAGEPVTDRNWCNG